MPTKKTSVHVEQNKVHTSPFLQISTLEHEQEMRVLDAQQRFEEERHESEKSFVNAEKTQEEMMRSKAMDALKEYAETEPAAIVKRSEKEIADAVDTITAQAEAQLPNVLSTILPPLLDGSLLSTAA